MIVAARLDKGGTTLQPASEQLYAEHHVRTAVRYASPTLLMSAINPRPALVAITQMAWAHAILIAGPRGDYMPLQQECTRS